MPGSTPARRRSSAGSTAGSCASRRARRSAHVASMRWRRAACRCRKSWPTARRCTGRPGLRLLFRITPFSQPPELDDWLAQRGYQRFEDTRVMVCPALPRHCRSGCTRGHTIRRHRVQKRTLTSWANFAVRRWPAGRRMPSACSTAPCPIRAWCCAGPMAKCWPARSPPSSPIWSACTTCSLRRPHAARACRVGSVRTCWPGRGSRARASPTCRWMRPTTRPAPCITGSVLPMATPTTTAHCPSADSD